MSDLISRDAVLEAIDAECGKWPPRDVVVRTSMTILRRYVAALPAAVAQVEGTPKKQWIDDANPTLAMLEAVGHFDTPAPPQPAIDVAGLVAKAMDEKFWGYNLGYDFSDRSIKQCWPDQHKRIADALTTLAAQLAHERERTERAFCDGRRAVEQIDELRHQRDTLAARLAAVETENDGLREGIDCAKRELDEMASRIAIYEDLRGASSEAIEMLTTRAEQAEAALADTKQELEHVLRDWNNLVKAVGAKTNGTAVGEAAAMRSELAKLGPVEEVICPSCVSMGGGYDENKDFHECMCCRGLGSIFIRRVLEEKE